MLQEQRLGAVSIGRLWQGTHGAHIRMKLSVIGLGYVGAVTAACLARDGHDVLGVDVDRTKLDLIGSGRAPIVEDEIQEVTEAAVSSGRLKVSEGVTREAIDRDLVFVCVGTPSQSNGSQDLRAVQRVTEQIGDALRDVAGYPTIVMRSTVYPGVTDEIVRPLLESRSGKRADRDFGLCFQPEFLREGSSVRDFYEPPFTVVGAADPRPASVVRELFGGLNAQFVSTDIRTAEMLKLACNVFHALKISFANEVGRLGRSLGVDGREVMRLVCMDRSLNISPAYMRPGFAFGGSCLPKDLRAMLYLARTNDADLPMLSGIWPSNLTHIEQAADRVMANGSRKVGLVGLSFKPGTDDLRESPLVSLAERLIGKGYELRILDPAVSLARLIGANRRYIEETIPHIGSLLVEDASALLEHADVIVLGHRNDELLRALAAEPRADRLLIDLVGVDPAVAGPGRYEGVCW